MKNFRIGQVEVTIYPNSMVFEKRIKGVRKPLEFRISTYSLGGSSILQQEVEGKKFQKALHRALSARHSKLHYTEFKDKCLESIQKEIQYNEKMKLEKLQKWMTDPLGWLLGRVKNSENTLPNGQLLVRGEYKPQLGWCSIKETWNTLITRLNGLEIGVNNEDLIKQIIEIETYRQSQANPFKKVSFSIE